MDYYNRPSIPLSFLYIKQLFNFLPQRAACIKLQVFPCSQARQAAKVVMKKAIATNKKDKKAREESRSKALP